ncbi:unnamed protein product, partial [marine sediment metagenome]
ETSKEPRTEIPERLQEILTQKPDIYINLLRGNREETPFRIKTDYFYAWKRPF